MDSTSIRLKDYKIARLKLSGDYQGSDFLFGRKNIQFKYQIIFFNSDISERTRFPLAFSFSGD